MDTLRSFSQKLADSGYDAASRQEILRSGIRKHYRDLAKATKEGSSIYRTRVQMNKKRELKTLLDKPWFEDERWNPAENDEGRD